MYFGTWRADDETPPLLCLNSNLLFVATGTVLSGQFDWGDLLPKGNISMLPSPPVTAGLAIRLYAGTPVNLGLRGSRAVRRRSP